MRRWVFLGQTRHIAEYSIGRSSFHSSRFLARYAWCLAVHGFLVRCEAGFILDCPTNRVAYGRLGVSSQPQFLVRLRRRILRLGVPVPATSSGRHWHRDLGLDSLRSCGCGSGGGSCGSCGCGSSLSFPFFLHRPFVGVVASVRGAAEGLLTGAEIPGQSGTQWKLPGDRASFCPVRIEPDRRELWMRYRLLGPLEVIGDDGQTVALGARERVLLATLVLGANQVVSTERLVDALWGEDPPATAANALQVHVSKLRKKLAEAGAGDVIARAPQGYVLQVGSGPVDLEEFEQLVGGATGDPAEVATRLREALALWRGPALADVSSDLLHGEKTRLEELRLLTIERRIEADLALGRHAELVGEIEALVQADPFREGPRRQLMLALYRSGRQADALATYGRHERSSPRSSGSTLVQSSRPSSWRS